MMFKIWLYDLFLVFFIVNNRLITKQKLKPPENQNHRLIKAGYPENRTKKGKHGEHYSTAVRIMEECTSCSHMNVCSDFADSKLTL